jgi:hydroxymethylpyrimidine/phosphomethylpyrimidine kinase
MSAISTPPLPVALTIAGSDSSAGAGLQADLKAFAAHGVYGLCAVTSVVAEIPGEVVAWEAVDPVLLRQQLDCVASGFPIGAAKTGMLATPALVDAVCAFLWEWRGRFPVVVDPVMVASSGDRLLVEAAIAGYRERLLPMAAVATPNLAEAAVLLDVEMADLQNGSLEDAAREFSDRYRCPVLIKGGHWQQGDDAVDVLWDGASIHRFAARRIGGVDTHGTGCTLSAAIAAQLARGRPLVEAIDGAKRYITAAITQALVWSREGKADGIRVLNHFPVGVGTADGRE